MSDNTLFVYGTLRPGEADTVLVKGQLFDLGWFPGIILGGTDDVVCEKIEVSDWQAVDRYEGYDPSCPEMSLYIRRPIRISDDCEGFIYEFNNQVNPVKRIFSGDWLDYTKEKRGINSGNYGS